MTAHALEKEGGKSRILTDRVLCQLVLSFLLGILVAVHKTNWLVAVALCYIIYISVSASRKRQRGKRGLATVLRILACLVVFTLGAYRQEQQAIRIQVADNLLKEGESVHVSGQIYKKEEKNQQIVYYLKNAYLKEQEKFRTCSKILVYPDIQHHDAYSIGTIIYVKGSNRIFREASNEGNFDEKSFYRSKGIQFALNGEDIHVIKEKVGGYQENLYTLKKKILAVYDQLLPEKVAGVLAVMSIGDKEFLDTDIKRLYQQSGISHILAISGLHVSILGAGIFRLLRKLRMTSLPACAIGIFFVYSFGILSGMEVSTQRAVMMFLVFMGANCMGMAYDLLTSLCFCMLVQLWDNPLYISYAGFLFSYAAVLGVAMSPVIIRALRKNKTEQEKKEKLVTKFYKKAGQTIFMSLCIQFTTLPLTLYYYYEFPAYSIIINGILLPFMGILLSCGLAGGIIGIFHIKLGWFVLQPCRVLLNWNEWVCRLFQVIPGAVCITGKPDIRLLVGYYAVLIGALLCMKLFTDKELGRWMKGVLLAVPAAALCCVLFLRSASEFEMVLLDVGQGDGMYIQSEEGNHFFIDGGSSSVSKVGEFRILPFLKSRGVSSIDGWFVSHGDADHVSGLKELWELGYAIDHLILAEGMVRDEALMELERMALEHGTKVMYLPLGGKVGTKSLVFTSIHPDEKILQMDRNGASMVLKMEWDDFSALFTGDIAMEQEHAMLENEGIEDVDFYKAAHHGSAGSNSSELLQALEPMVTVISCAGKNSYGHPAPEAVERIEESGSRIFYTMESGQVTVKWDKGKMWVKEFKGTSRQKAPLFFSNCGSGMPLPIIHLTPALPSRSLLFLMLHQNQSDPAPPHYHRDQLPQRHLVKPLKESFYPLKRLPCLKIY